MHSECDALGLVLAFTLTLRLATASAAPVPQLTDLNFDSLVNQTSPPWMIEIYAPWCPACREMEPAWQQLATELHPEGIRVGKVDGTQEAGLLNRFAVQHYPAIYLTRGQETREHVGGRGVAELAAFAREGWRDVTPRTGCSSPVSRCGVWVGKAASIPARAKRTFFHLRDKKRYSDVSLVAGLLAVPVTLGLMCICMLDVYHTRRRPEDHLHHT